MQPSPQLHFRTFSSPQKDPYVQLQSLSDPIPSPRHFIIFLLKNMSQIFFPNALLLKIELRKHFYRRRMFISCKNILIGMFLCSFLADSLMMQGSAESLTWTPTSHRGHGSDGHPPKTTESPQSRDWNPPALLAQQWPLQQLCPSDDSYPS